MKDTESTWFFGSLVIAMTAGLAGHLFGGSNKVAEGTCLERRHACNNLIIERIQHLNDAINRLEDKLDKLTIG